MFKYPVEQKHPVEKPKNAPVEKKGSSKKGSRSGSKKNSTNDASFEDALPPLFPSQEELPTTSSEEQVVGLTRKVFFDKKCALVLPSFGAR